MPCSEKAYHFMHAKSLESAAKVVLGGIIEQKAYQHYCRLDRVLGKIIQRRWFLAQCSSLKMNDLQEPRKFAGETDVLKRTFITCFEHCLAEDVAMWGLYAKNDPLALRVTIPGKVLVDWMRRIEVKSDDGHVHWVAKRKAVKEMGIQDEKNKAVSEGTIQSSVFRDMLYASVTGDTEREEYDIRRGNRVSWENAYYTLKNDEKEDRIVQSGQYAGFIKDCEWMHERESRLCIRLNKGKKVIDTNCISIKIPLEVIAAMRFTFSPWLRRSEEKRVENVIKAALKGAGVDLDAKPRFQRFRRSVLQGALNFR